MENKTKKSLPLFVFIAIAGLFVVVLLPLLSNKNSTPVPTPLSQEANESDVIITEIDFGDTEPVQITLEETNHTAFSALQKAIETTEYELLTEQYDFGVFIKSINGYESSAERSWIYFVNDVTGDIAADQKELQPGDKVSWKYLEPTAE